MSSPRPRTRTPTLARPARRADRTARDECHKAAPSADRWKIRSKFYHGIASAMADQWGAIAQAGHAAA